MRTDRQTGCSTCMSWWSYPEHKTVKHKIVFSNPYTVCWLITIMLSREQVDLSASTLTRTCCLIGDPPKKTFSISHEWIWMSQAVWDQFITTSFWARNYSLWGITLFFSISKTSTYSCRDRESYHRVGLLHGVVF